MSNNHKRLKLSLYYLPSWISWVMNLLAKKLWKSFYVFFFPIWISRMLNLLDKGGWSMKFLFITPGSDDLQVIHVCVLNFPWPWFIYDVLQELVLHFRTKNSTNLINESAIKWSENSQDLNLFYLLSSVLSNCELTAVFDRTRKVSALRFNWNYMYSFLLTSVFLFLLNGNLCYFPVICIQIQYCTINGKFLFCKVIIIWDFPVLLCFSL